jgi:hypothetical protein
MTNNKNALLINGDSRTTEVAFEKLKSIFSSVSLLPQTDVESFAPFDKNIDAVVSIFGAENPAAQSDQFQSSVRGETEHLYRNARLALRLAASQKTPPSFTHISDLRRGAPEARLIQMTVYGAAQQLVKVAAREGAAMHSDFRANVIALAPYAGAGHDAPRRDAMDVLAYLANDDASYVTATTIRAISPQ